MIHEIAYIESFITSNRRDRYLTFIKSKKGRSKFLSTLYHHHINDIKPEHYRQISGRLQVSEEILKLIRTYTNEQECHIISARSSKDGQTLNLEDALNATVGQNDGTILSILPGKLAYYEGEEPGERYIITSLPPPKA